MRRSSPKTGARRDRPPPPQGLFLVFVRYGHPGESDLPPLALTIPFELIYRDLCELFTSLLA